MRETRWSPEQISGWLCERGVKLSQERIYQMIWQDKRDGGDLWRSLRRRGKRYNKRGGKNAGRGVIPDRIDISERPTIVARKARLGDWEGDTIVSAGHKGGLLTHFGQAPKKPNWPIISYQQLVTQWRDAVPRLRCAVFFFCAWFSYV